MNVFTHHARLARALGALLFLLVLVQPVHAMQTEPPDLPAYTALVREAATAARRGDRLGLEDAAARLVAVREVRVAGGILPADNRWLADELARPAPRIALIAERLAALADALALPPSAAPSDATERLGAILARPPFAERVSQTPQWWTDFWNWVGRVLEALLRRFPNVTPANTGAGTTPLVVAALGALLLLGVVLYLLRGLRRGIVGGVRAREDDAEARLTARAALDQAGELARAGDSRTAVRYLYLAALLRLDERGVLRYDRALTNREYLDRLRDNPELRVRLTPIVATFDRVWYGYIVLSSDEYREFAQHVERLRDDS